MEILVPVCLQCWRSRSSHFIHVGLVSGMGGAELFPAGRGKGENPRGGAKKHVNRLIPRQKVLPLASGGGQQIEQRHKR